MDPYLEDPSWWRDVHGELIPAIRAALTPQVAPEYYVAIDEEVYLVPAEPDLPFIRPDAFLVASPTAVESPERAGAATAVRSGTETVRVPIDDTIHEAYLEIRKTGTHEVCTVIELLSPTNKLSTQGRDQYTKKRRAVLNRWTSLVEIDLLRAGEPMEMTPRPESDYRVLVRRGWERQQAHLYAFGVREALPEVSVPLGESENEATLVLGEILAAAYDRARWDLRINYQMPPPDPTLSEDDTAWLDGLLKAAGRRA
jgi:hypothetical protein